MRKIKKIARDRKILGEFAEACFTMKAASLGLVASRPHGDSMPYDVIVDNGRRLKRIQVKSAASLQQRAYHVSTSMRKGKGYRRYAASQVDAIVAYVIPEDAWYIIPIHIISHYRNICLFPHVAHSRGKFEKYREAWHLLLPEPSRRRIFAQADTGIWDDMLGVGDETSIGGPTLTPAPSNARGARGGWGFV